MAVTMRNPRKPPREPEPLFGQEKPRLAPPTPARSLVDDFIKTAKDIGIDLFPWQVVVARYLQARGPGEAWLYRHVAVIVARQNGKTRLLVPLIVSRLRMGHRIMHTAQDRNLPREVYSEVADIMAASPGELAVKNGRIVMPRFANGQEEIRMKNGGIYSIVAPTRGGARGPSRDLVIIDELREMTDHDFIAAANPTLQASKSPQMLYLSNAGDESSVVLNAIKASQDADPTLAYLEWSAAPERDLEDHEGWAQANPSIGHLPGMLGNLEMDLQTYRARGELAIFETENLCRWVTSMRPKLVDEEAWIACHGPLEAPVRPVLAFSMDPDGHRASAAIAWRRPDGSIGLRLTYDVTGNPIDTDRLGEDLRKDAARLGIRHVGFDPLTDGHLAKWFKKPTPVRGQAFANATSTFVNLVNAGKLRWADADAVTADLVYTARKDDRESGSFEAVRVKDDRPITASLAAIRAVALAASPPLPSPKVM
jgi:phage terminase large subunit-like protein